MLYNDRIEFTKNDIDSYLKEVSKEYKERSGRNIHAEIILVGGASVLINYGFRQMTTDVDAMYEAASSMRDAINSVGEKFDLPNGWLNTDFINTNSYTPELRKFATHYKTFYQVVDVYTIKAEYLIAMKLKSGRMYKNDLSDVLGILNEHKKAGNGITLSQIQKSVINLYGSWEAISEQSREFIESMLKDEKYVNQYEIIHKQELENKDALLMFEEDYPKAVNKSNVDEIMQMLIDKMKDNGK